jgi:hypothetical protein
MVCVTTTVVSLRLGLFACHVQARLGLIVALGDCFTAAIKFSVAWHSIDNHDGSEERMMASLVVVKLQMAIAAALQFSACKSSRLSSFSLYVVHVLAPYALLHL